MKSGEYAMVQQANPVNPEVDQRAFMLKMVNQNQLHLQTLMTAMLVKDTNQ